MNFTVLSMEFRIRTCLLFFFQTDRNFYQIILSKYSGQKSKQIADKKFQMSSEIKLLAGTKVYYSFNSKGDNFKVNQL